MEPASDEAVVVGVDGSLGSARALDVAIAEATVRHRPLRLLHAFQWPVYTAETAVDAAFESARPDARDAARHMLAEQCEYARNAAPDLRVEELFVEGVSVGGSVAAALIAAASRAVLTVLGRRGLGGFAGLLLGSVSTQVAAHAPGPVMVVPATGVARSGPVVVGVDASATAQLAVGFGFEEASWHGAPLTAVHAYAGQQETDYVEERLLAEALAGWQERYPDVAVTRALDHGAVPATLLSYAAKAHMVVVGARGRGGFRGLLVGSTSQAILHHAPCPVVVVHERAGT